MIWYFVLLYVNFMCRWQVNFLWVTVIKNNKLSLYFPLQNCTNQYFFNIIQFINYTEFIKNMLFVYFANLKKLKIII